MTTKNDEWKPLLDEVYETCQAQAQEEPENERFMGWEALYGVLIYEGIKLCLPEIKAWLKLPAMQLALFREKLEKKLKEYALEKELDYQKAEQAAARIVAAVDNKLLARLFKASFPEDKIPPNLEKKE
ncbi:MAG: hypothetical protein ACE1ZS_05725 [Candidatus Poribacteria bacterium]